MEEQGWEVDGRVLASHGGVLGSNPRATTKTTTRGETTGILCMTIAAHSIYQMLIFRQYFYLL